MTITEIIILFLDHLDWWLRFEKRRNSDSRGQRVLFRFSEIDERPEKDATGLRRTLARTAFKNTSPEIRWNEKLLPDHRNTTTHTQMHYANASQKWTMTELHE